MAQVFRQRRPLEAFLEARRSEGQQIGFVPTMGALHQGHASLLNACRANNDISVCSIFVNPTQFNRQSDFISYPRTPEHDVQIIENAGIDVLFLPDEKEIYAQAGDDYLNGFEIGYLDTVMEGAYRPGHFKGVATIVKIFLELIKPHNAYFGRKDYQQLLVVKKMASFFDLPTRIIGCDTVREPGGLAMSSRNMRLNEAQREKAAGIFRTLQQAKQKLREGQSPAETEEWGFEQLNSLGFETDYFKIADADTLEPVNTAGEAERLIICTAATIGGVRLIDNILA